METAELPGGIEAVIAALGTPAVLLDPSGIPVAASSAAAEVGLLDSGVHPDVAALAGEARGVGEAVRRDVTLRRVGLGEQVSHLRLTASLVGPRCVLVVAEDRSDSVRLDEVRRDFVANISHELKTPIGAVSLLAEAIDSAADDPAQVRRFATRLGEEARRLADMTQDIIELSRVQGLEPLAGAGPVPIDVVVAGAIEPHRVAAESRGIEIAARVPKRRLLVAGVEATLTTAVGNLVTNAVQYSPDGSRVGVGVMRRGDRVEIAVTDHGPGIPEEERGRIFERFFRGDPARSRQTGGTGLGLSIAKHAIASHGGEIRLWSEPGHGSTFTIVLPLLPVIEQGPEATHEEATA